jgi:hypothetical protein
VSGRRRAEPDAGLLASLPAARGLGSTFAARCLVLLMFLGGVAGSVQLVIDGVVREGVLRWVYAVTMVVCMALAAPLAVRRRAGRGLTFGLVLFGDLVYLVIALSVSDPVRYATPLMLLSPCSSPPGSSASANCSRPWRSPRRSPRSRWWAPTSTR